jgi:cytochrome b
MMNLSYRKVLVWDAPTRLFHWLTVVLVIAAYTTWRMNLMDWHAWTGDTLLALLLFRLLWGFFGSETARFSAFLASPRAARSNSLMGFVANPIAKSAIIQPAAGWCCSCSRSCSRRR